jgi:hypothetical protein
MRDAGTVAVPSALQRTGPGARRFAELKLQRLQEACALDPVDLNGSSSS